MQITDKDRLDFVIKHFDLYAEITASFTSWISQETEKLTFEISIDDDVDEDGEVWSRSFLGTSFNEAIDNAIMAMREKDK